MLSWRLFHGLTVLLSLVTLASTASAGRLGAPLPLMLQIRERGDQREQWDWLLPGIARDEVGLTVRLREPLEEELRRRVLETGVHFNADEEGRPRHIGPIYSVTAPWSSVVQLAALPEIGRIELARQPGLVSHLDVSAPEIQAPQVWAQLDPSSRPNDGAGMVVADFDSGIDVFHPLFFQADGGVYDWIDVDGDGVFRAGVDVVDLDGDGEVDGGEALGLLEGALIQNGRGWVDGSYDADIDWLYNDSDGNGERDYGPDAGYTDLDPSFGEMLFITADVDEDGVLDPGEPLIGLATSKIIATLVWPSVTRYRGTDVSETPVEDPDYIARYGSDDRADHGTGVSSILVGGWSDAGRRITGVAPGAELVLVDFNNEMGLAATLPWAISLGAMASSHPYGHKIFSFLDGSSNEELAIDLAYEQFGALQAVSVGNEASNGDDASVTIPSEEPRSVPFVVQRYDWQTTPITLVAMTVRWTRPEVALIFRLRNPDGVEVNLGSGNGSIMIDGAQVDHTRENSTRGTAKFDIVIYRGAGLAVGDWDLEVLSLDEEPTDIRLTIFNDIFRGGSGTGFTDEEQIDRMATVSAYATADRAIGACSYGTRHSRRGEAIGQISNFSSRGPRIDGFRIVDICAPGDNDIIWAQSSRGDLPLGGYSFGGGTSASAPHVAAALTLIRQAAPWATATEIEDAMFGGAYVDDFVGEVVPNHTWGFGKLRIDDAIALLPSGPEEVEEEQEIDEAPWERGLTPDAGLPQPERAAQLVGIEGGGCHCQSQNGGRSEQLWEIFRIF